MPAEGTGNIAADPELASWSHLSARSPCIGSGSALYTTGLDIDGELYGNPPCMGADQFTVGAAISPLSVELETDFTDVTVGYAASFKAHIEGQTTANRWDFGDGTLLTNRIEAVHAWQSPGTYPVQLTVVNDSHPDGISATVTVHVVEVPVFYVNPGNSTPAFPYLTWATAATDIQSAIGAGAVAGRVVLVTNGVYETDGVAVWGQMTNRIALINGVVVRSVNGPDLTILRGAPAPSGTNGDGAIRCVYVGEGSVLDGFTLTNGHTRTAGHTSREQGGGGAWCARTGVVTNCVFIGNEAFRDGGGANGGMFYACTFLGNRAWDDSGGVDDATLHDCVLRGNSALGGNGGGASESILDHCLLSDNRAAVYGGGADESTLNNCTLIGNSAGDHGGGALESELTNCTLIGNSASRGGGVTWGELRNCTLQGNSAEIGGGTDRGTLNNSIVFSNTATIGANYFQDQYGGVLNYCCTTPLPTNGIGNITNAPLFVDAAAGNLRLQSNSPCINAGFNAYASGDTDLDGLPRIAGGTVDMGAYEFQSPASVISYAWLQQYGLPTDGSVDFTDPDGDGLNNWQEWCCRTDPTNAFSVLRLLAPSPAGSNVNVSWQSMAGVNYFLERSTNLSGAPPFALLATNLIGQAGATTFTDTNLAGNAPRFYRVEVKEP